MLDLGDIGVMLYETFNSAEHLINDKAVIMEEMITAISFLNNAELELSYRLLEESRNTALQDTYPILTTLLNVSNAFGITLIDTLKSLGVYSNGYLQYAYDSWNGPLLVLGKIDVASVSSNNVDVTQLV